MPTKLFQSTYKFLLMTHVHFHAWSSIQLKITKFKVTSSNTCQFADRNIILLIECPFHWYNCHTQNSTLHEFNLNHKNTCKEKFRSRSVCNFYVYSAVIVVFETGNWRLQVINFQHWIQYASNSDVIHFS